MKEIKKKRKKFEIGSGLVLSVVMMAITTWNDGWLLWIKKREKHLTNDENWKLRLLMTLSLNATPKIKGKLKLALMTFYERDKFHVPAALTC